MQPDQHYIDQQVELALQEDIGSGDVTAQLIPEDRQARANIVCRQDAVLCGTAWVDTVFSRLDPQVSIAWQAKDGAQVRAGQILCWLDGPARALLSGERTALNFLQTLSATASQTRRYVDAVAGTGCRILDTRKTLPGLRLAQKYAVVCGGGVNHRIGLYDMILIKENHILAAGSIRSAVATARQLNPSLPIEVEVENLAELQQALDSKVTRILLDNMDISTLKRAVAMSNGKTPLEASGGVELERISDIAATGVDYISVGGITKHIRAVDLSMRFID